MMKRTTYSSLLASLALVALMGARPAFATPCGAVTAAGSCDDKATLSYCRDGQLVQIECPTGELCVTDDARFDGAAGCVAASLAGCDEVDEAGACAARDTLVFCDAREVKRRTCPVGTSCGWVEEEGWFDCISSHISREEGFANRPRTDTPPDRLPGTPAPVETDTPAEPSPSEGPQQAPIVAAGGAPAAGEFDATGSGCEAGRGVDSAMLFFGIVGLWLSARRRRHALLGKR